MGIKKDLARQKFGHWTVISDSGKRNSSGVVMWLCECKCGIKRAVSATSLIGGKSLSCGRCSKLKITNRYVSVDDDTTLVHCADGALFMIDTSDLTMVKNYQWWVDTKGYVKTKIENRGVPLHRLLLNVTGKGRDVFVDHISGDTSDNRKANLRICTPSENIKNRKLNVTNTSGYKGVSHHRKTNKYMAGIRAGGGKTIYLGLYPTAQEAAAAYDRAAVLYHGEFARTNRMLGLLEDEHENCKTV